MTCELIKIATDADARHCLIRASAILEGNP